MALAGLKAWSRGKWLSAVAALIVVLAGGWLWLRGERVYLRWVLESPRSGRCQQRLNREVLKRSLQLGTGFLLAHQKPAGNFDYEYDWRTQLLSDDDQETRQAGALWGLALLYQDRPTAELKQAVERGLTFFNEHSRRVKAARCTTYGNNRSGRVGTIALVALAHIDYLRAAKELTPERRTELEANMTSYLQALVLAQHPSGLWYADYDTKTCAFSGEPSSYSDGEALLAWVKAAKYLNQKDLLPLIPKAAKAGKELNVDQALKQNADSDVTKGYYQWSSMAFYELATSDIPGMSVYGDTVLQLADWVIDEHAILTRTRNTGYAFEGITHAYALAKQRHDPREAKFRCVIDVGMERLLGWQVGGPLANRYAAAASASDAEALGGIQNAAFEPELRIDVTQHQMHATQLALSLVY